MVISFYPRNFRGFFLSKKKKNPNQMAGMFIKINQTVYVFSFGITLSAC